jgi:hypothetical protein
MQRPIIWRVAMLAALATCTAGVAQARDISAAAAEAYASAPPQDLPDGTDENVPEPTPIDDATLAKVLNADFAPSKPKPWARPSSNAAPDFKWDKTSNSDGSAKYSVNKPLGLPWDAKIGADISVAPPPAASYEPRQLPSSTSNSGSGSAWANVAVPALATVELRAEPANDYDKVGTKLERSVPLGKSLSVTLQGSLGFTELRAPSTTTPASAAPPIPNVLPSQAAARLFDTDKSLQLNILSSSTTLLAGSSTVTGDPVTHNRLSAAQKIYGPLNVTGSVYDVGQQTSSKSITAGLSFSW